MMSRRVATFFLLPLLVLSCSGAALGPAPEQGSNPDPAKYDQLVVVGTNDFHGYLRPSEAQVEGAKVIMGGAEWFAGYVRILEKKYGDRLVMLDGGDIFQGTIESNFSRGQSTMAYYNLLPYRAASVGNHEFDYGPLQRGGKDKLGAIKARMAEARFPFLQANIFRRGTNELWREKNLQPSVIVNAGGYRVGLFGLTTTTTPAKTLPQNVVGLEYRNFVEPAKAMAKKLREEGADFVFLTTHEGGERPGEPIYEMLHALPPGTIDAVVSGHAHSEIHEFVNGTPVIQSKTRGMFFGRIDLFVDKATRKLAANLTKIHPMTPICGNWFARANACDAKTMTDAIKAGQSKPADAIPLRTPVYEGEAVQPDLAVRAALEPFLKKVDLKRREFLGTAQKDFEYYPTGENQMAQMFLRAFHWKYPKSKVVYLNGGGIRRRFYKGIITYGDLYEVHPFDNFAAEVKMTGAQLKSLIQVGTSGVPMIPSAWGIKFSYATDDKPEYERDVDGNGKKEKWERNRLLSVTWMDGRPVKDNEEFWVATHDYLVSGGDNTAKIFDSIPASKRKMYEITSRDVVAEYLKLHPKLELPSEEELRITPVGPKQGPQIH